MPRSITSYPLTGNRTQVFQNFELVLVPAVDGRYAIADQQWRLFAESLTSTSIGLWHIEGVNLASVGKFADIGAPLQLAESVETVRFRHCPSLRPKDYASISTACRQGNVRSLQLQPLASQSSPYELVVEQMMEALSNSALNNVVLVSAKMSVRFLQCLLKVRIFEAKILGEF